MNLLVAGRIVQAGTVARGWLDVERGVVRAAGSGPPPGAPDLAWHGTIAPGLVDLQVNGAAGFEVTGGAAALDRIDATLLAHGVTSYLAALVSGPEEDTGAAVAALAERAADPASPLSGVHVEGPFLSAARRGTHREQWLREPATGVPDWLFADAVRIVTLAPGLAGAEDLIARLGERGIAVSLGHSPADAAAVTAAVDAGARLVTHLFNAMPAMSAREPGLAGVALTDERLAPMVIADGIHVAAAMLELARRAAGDRLILVSDCVPGAGALPGRYDFAGRTVLRDRAGEVRDEEGRLAGSGALLDDCVRTFAALTGATLADAVEAASERPAAVAGLPAPLQPGSPADLVLLDADGDVHGVMRGGAWVVAPDRT